MPWDINNSIKKKIRFGNDVDLALLVKIQQINIATASVQAGLREAVIRNLK